MIGIKEAKAAFFDSAKVLKSVDAATRRVLSKFGAYVRTAARSSIRKRRRVSEPGSPPSSHTGLLKRFIFFGYEDRKQSVVIGPTLLNGTSGMAPAALEHGGPTRIVTITGRNGRKRTKTVTVAARPFMAPALKQELPKLPGMWANSVKP